MVLSMLSVNRCLKTHIRPYTGRNRNQLSYDQYTFCHSVFSVRDGDTPTETVPNPVLRAACSTCLCASEHCVVTLIPPPGRKCPLNFDAVVNKLALARRTIIRDNSISRPIR